MASHLLGGFHRVRHCHKGMRTLKVGQRMTLIHTQKSVRVALWEVLHIWKLSGWAPHPNLSGDRRHPQFMLRNVSELSFWEATWINGLFFSAAAAAAAKPPDLACTIKEPSEQQRTPASQKWLQRTRTSKSLCVPCVHGEALSGNRIIFCASDVENSNDRSHWKKVSSTDKTLKSVPTNLPAAGSLRLGATLTSSNSDHLIAL